MNDVSYVTLDPTGNITCLVTHMPCQADEKAVTEHLMHECEQVAYLEVPHSDCARARIRLMGGEFCGNAAMASACYLAQCDGILPGQEADVPLEMSGAHSILNCHISSHGDSFEGTVPMPEVTDLRSFSSNGYHLCAVHMEGIVHLILSGPPFPTDKQAEALLRQLALQQHEEAVGLLLWDEENQRMRPLVLVKGSGTLVWETGCGSGSAAVGAFRTRMLGCASTSVAQPGGRILVDTEVLEDKITGIRITGRVRIGPEHSFSPVSPPNVCST